MTIVDWGGIPLTSIAVEAAPLPVSGGRNAYGREKVIESDAGFWRANVTGVLLTRENVVAYRAVLAKTAGRANSLRLKICEQGRSPGGLAYAPSLFAQQPWTGPVNWTGDVGWVGGVVWSRLVTSIAQRATSLVASATPADAVIQPGQYFTMGDRLYMVRDASKSTDWSISFWPPAREAVTAPATLDFNFPHGLWRIASATPFDTDRGKGSTVELSLVEAL